MPNPVLTKAIDVLAQRRDLSAEQAGEVLAEIMRGDASEVEIAGFLVGLRTKGETVQELAGLAGAMREFAARVVSERDGLLDTAGTGGGRSTFNVSTTAALIAAGAGQAVAKHGNRSATSLCGSADLLEALGARIDLEAPAVGRCIDETGFGFMFAPLHHQATRFVVPVRRELAVRTVFNLLGPLTNPAGARRQLIGVSGRQFLEIVAGALSVLGAERALVVASEDNLDEISVMAPTHVIEVHGHELRRYVLDPADLGVPGAGGTRTAADGSRGAQELRGAAMDGVGGGTPAQNAAVTRAILQAGRGPAAAMALANAGAAIYVAGGAGTIAEGVEAAREALGQGRAAQVLERYVRATLSEGAEREAPRE